MEIIFASSIFALLLSLAKVGSWGNLNYFHVLQSLLYISWIMLVVLVLLDILKRKIEPLKNIVWFFWALVMILSSILVSTCVLNIMTYWGAYFSFGGITYQYLYQNLGLDLSYGVLLGGICLCYVDVRKKLLIQQSAQRQADLQSLQARIKPHFLFNSLNTVVCLIGHDAEKAEQILIDLAKLFRVSLEADQLVSLSYEIELCKYYVEIQKNRLGSKLQVEWRIEYGHDFSKVKIPLLTLQPLLENSILHGVEQHDCEAKVSILVELFSNQVSIVITNPVLKDKITIRDGQGFAVLNIKQRLVAYFGPAAKLQHYVNNGMYITLIQYPLQTRDR